MAPGWPRRFIPGGVRDPLTITKTLRGSFSTCQNRLAAQDESARQTCRRQTANRKSAAPSGRFGGAKPLYGDFRLFPQTKHPYTTGRHSRSTSEGMQPSPKWRSHFFDLPEGVFMLRLGNLSLPLDYTEDGLTQLVLRRLKLPASRLVRLTLVKKSVDARDKADVHFVLTVDAEVRDEADVLRHLKRGVAERIVPRTAAPLPRRRPVRRADPGPGGGLPHPDRARQGRGAARPGRGRHAKRRRP